MKKIATVLLAFTALSFSAVAQETSQSQEFHQHDEAQFHHHRGMEMKELNLSQEQIAQVKKISKDYHEQLKALNKNEDITVREYRDKMYALKKDHKAKFMGILSEEQKTKLAQLKNKRMQDHELMAAKHLDKMKTKLNLTDDQVSKMEEQGKASFEKLRAIRDNDNLTREQKKEQLMALKNETKGNFKKLLTPDQLNKLDQMKKARMEKSNS